MNSINTNLAVVKPWARRIRNHLQTGIESFIKAGHDLDAAVEDFKQQDGKHWKHTYSELLAEVKISQQTAYTLRTIARHPVLSDPSNYGALPGSWSTLGELASLPGPELEQRIEAGEITPELKREQVRQWKQLNHLPASGSPQHLEPLVGCVNGLRMPDDLSEQEIEEVGIKLFLFWGMWRAHAVDVINRAEVFMEDPNEESLELMPSPSELMPRPGEKSSYFQKLNEIVGGRVIWVTIMTRLNSGRPVVGVLYDNPDKNQKRPGDGQEAEL